MASKPHMNNKNQIVCCNLTSTQYEVVRHVCAEIYKWNINDITEDDECDLIWTDSSITPNKLIKMKRFQKINHFPGMYSISQKNYLAINLNKLRKIFPDAYNFFPRTWAPPLDGLDLKLFLNSNPNTYLIVKPEASCQGRGIYLTRKIDEIENERYIVQEYLSNPCLIDNLKFDLRIYALITSCSPLRIFMYQEGLTRLATEEYAKPNNSNVINNFMHLTNYAINKLNKNFKNNSSVQQDNIGHKRSFTSSLKYFENLGANIDLFIKKIESIIIKTICCIQPILAHYYKSSQPEDLTNSMCFEILGFDIIVDSQFEPYLLEVNHTPSFSTDSPLDWEIKKNLIYDTLKILNITYKNRLKFLKKEKEENKIRNLSGVYEKPTKEEKNERRNYLRSKKDIWETFNCGNYKKIYPVDKYENYDKYIKAADDLWQEYTGTKVKLVKKFEVKKRVSPKKKVSENIKPQLVCSYENKLVYDRLSKQLTRTYKSNIFPKIVYQHVRVNHFQVNRTEKIFNFDTVDEGLNKKIILEKSLKEMNNNKKKSLPIVKINNTLKKMSLKDILMLDDLKPIFKNQMALRNKFGL